MHFFRFRFVLLKINILSMKFNKSVALIASSLSFPFWFSIGSFVHILKYFSERKKMLTENFEEKRKLVISVLTQRHGGFTYTDLNGLCLFLFIFYLPYFIHIFSILLLQLNTATRLGATSPQRIKLEEMNYIVWTKYCWLEIITSQQASDQLMSRDELIFVLTMIYHRATNCVDNGNQPNHTYKRIF